MASEKLFEGVPPFPNDMATASIQTISFKQLNSKQERAAQDLFTACQELGFFLLDMREDPLGDVVIQEIDRLWELMKEILNLPENVKTKWGNDFPKSLHGFKPHGASKTETKESDRYEWLDMALDGILGNTPFPELPDILSAQSELLKSFTEHAREVAFIVCEILAEQLSLPASSFTTFQSPVKLSGSSLRMIKTTPSHALADLRTSMIHHTDFGTITLLANIVGGLQVLTPGKDLHDQSAWVYVRPQPGCLIVNLGDAMVQWTAGLLRSNCHRVTFAPGEQRYLDRYSMAILFRPDRDASMKEMVRNKGDGVKQRQLQNQQDEYLTADQWLQTRLMAYRNGEEIMHSKGGRLVGAV